MSKLDIIQIVPRLPPAIDGLGDHAQLLAKTLEQNHGIRSRFVVGDPQYSASVASDHFSVDVVAGRDAKSLTIILEQVSPRISTVILHYVGYGYARRGCPSWLVSALKRWRLGSECRRLITVFHEVYAFGPPWTSSFWTSALQRALAKQLIDISDSCRTSMKRYARVLGGMSKRRRNRVLSIPIFSNAGELASPTLAEQRKRQLIVFGGAASREAIYQRDAELDDLCARLCIDEIVDIGPQTVSKRKLSCRLTWSGTLPPEKVSHSLTHALGGVLSYPAAFLAKSTIFAAYAAHGVAPILVNPGTARSEDGLILGTHYLEGTHLAHDTSDRELQEIGNHAFAWYAPHALKKQAEELASSLLMQ